MKKVLRNSNLDNIPEGQSNSWIKYQIWLVPLVLFLLAFFFFIGFPRRCIFLLIQGRSQAIFKSLYVALVYVGIQLVLVKATQIVHSLENVGETPPAFFLFMVRLRKSIFLPLIAGILIIIMIWSSVGAQGQTPIKHETKVPFPGFTLTDLGDKEKSYGLFKIFNDPFVYKQYQLFQSTGEPRVDTNSNESESALLINYYYFYSSKLASNLFFAFQKDAPTSGVGKDESQEIAYSVRKIQKKNEDKNKPEVFVVEKSTPHYGFVFRQYLANFKNLTVTVSYQGKADEQKLLEAINGVYEKGH